MLLLTLHIYVFILFVSWPTDAESDVASDVGRQQRVMIIGNNNVFEVGCCILFVHDRLHTLSPFTACIQPTNDISIVQTGLTNVTNIQTDTRTIFKPNT